MVAAAGRPGGRRVYGGFLGGEEAAWGSVGRGGG